MNLYLKWGFNKEYATFDIQEMQQGLFHFLHQINLFWLAGLRILYKAPALGSYSCSETAPCVQSFTNPSCNFLLPVIKKEQRQSDTERYKYICIQIFRHCVDSERGNKVFQSFLGDWVIKW